jgi:hypothetical protein
MNEQSLESNELATDAQAPQGKSQETGSKTYTQEEFDNHIAGLKHSLTKKFEKQFAELGDIEELKQLKSKAEQARTEEAMKKGEFEKILQELATKKDAEISKRENVIREFKVDVPLINAAAKYRSVNPEQVKALLKSNVRLNNDGEVEVLDNSGSVRYSDKGVALSVDDLVREWLDTNPHFVQPTPATTNSKSSFSNGKADFDPSQLDLTNPEERKLYGEWRKTQYSGVRKMSS